MPPMTKRILWPVFDLHKGDNQFIGISIISPLLKQHGFGSEAIGADIKLIRERLKRGDIDVVAYSTPTIYADTYLELNRRLKKEFRFLSVFGGPHPTFFPDMINEDGVDVICVGEGEYAMLELMQSLGQDLSRIENLWVKENGTIHKNPLRPLLQDLDALPLPDHEIFRTAIPRSIWQALVITSRGCPYSCTYCFNHVYRELYRGKGKIIRRRSVDHVLEELELIKSRGCYRFIRFLDDLFTLDPEWVEEFAAKYQKRIGLPFSCLVRANHITPEIARQLKAAGCWRVQMGVEAGDDFIRNEVFKRNMSEEEILRASRIIQEAGLKLVTGNILGAPGATLEKDLKTLYLNMKIKPAFAGLSLLQPYPGTEVHKYAMAVGMLDSSGPELKESTFRKVSSLKYADQKEKNAIENLEKLFFLPVEWPWTLSLVRRLIRLPAKRFYHFIFSRWVNYCQYFRVIPPRIGRRNFFKRAKVFTTAAEGWDALARRLGIRKAPPNGAGSPP